MLAQLTGADFDSTFAKHMLEDHEKVVKLFKAEAKDGHANPLKAFASATLPTLEEHLKIATALARVTSGL